MKIINGIYKNFNINYKNINIRPTTSLVKESIFNIMNNCIDIKKSTILDLYSGTGNIALEFISRECIEATSVDNNVNCINFIKKCKKILEIYNLNIIKSDAIKFIKNQKYKYDIIYIDPPYSKIHDINIINNIVFNNPLNKKSWYIIEHYYKFNFKNNFLIKTKKYGDTVLSIFYI
ncbi:MAG: RsmD family RNA methyltransferase [Bacteroides sp.]|nr:MAG: RsmD family RNA methyltransferase [Bacteroides sp.]